jgi:hypothetical protein
MSPARAATRRDLVGPWAGAGFGLLILVLSLQIRDAGNGIYGPRFWPQLIGALILAINGWVIIRTVMGRAEPRDEALDGSSMAINLRSVGVRHWITAVLVLGFPLTVYLLGFLTGSVAFLVAFMFGLGYRRWYVVVATALVFSLSITWFFTAGVFTPLPPGKGVFYLISTEFARLITR